MRKLLYLKITILLSVLFGYGGKLSAQDQDFLKQIMKETLKNDMKNDLLKLSPEASKDTLSYLKGNIIKGTDYLEESYKNEVLQISENLLKPYTNPKNESGYDPLKDNRHLVVKTLHDKMGANMISVSGMMLSLTSLFSKSKSQGKKSFFSTAERKWIEGKTNKLYEEELKLSLENDSIAYFYTDSIK